MPMSSVSFVLLEDLIGDSLHHLQPKTRFEKMEKEETHALFSSSFYHYLFRHRIKNTNQYKTI